MSDSQSPEMRGFKRRLELWTAVAVVLGMFATLIERAVGVEQVQRGHTTALADHKIKLDEHERRIRAMEVSRTIEQQITALAIQNAEFRTKIGMLENTISELRRARAR